MAGFIPPNSSLVISSQAGTWARSCHCCPDHDVHDDDYVVVGDDDGDYVNDGDDDNSLGDDRSRDKKLGLFLLQKSIEQIRLKSRSDNFLVENFEKPSQITVIKILIVAKLSKPAGWEGRPPGVCPHLKKT